MQEKIQKTQGDDFILEMSRQFPRSREKVFAAFADYNAMAAWFGPHGTEVVEGSLDFEVGGRYRMVIKGESGTNIVGGIYKEIVTPEKISFSWRWEPKDDMPDKEMEITIEFRELNTEKTELFLRQTLVPDQSVAESHAWGWGETFEKLATLLQSVK